MPLLRPRCHILGGTCRFENQVLRATRLFSRVEHAAVVDILTVRRIWIGWLEAGLQVILAVKGCHMLVSRVLLII